jgi:serine/threonine protein kinase
VHEILEDDGHYYIISELMNGGELYDRILKMKKFTEKDVATICIQILRGLNYMHKKNIVHRDIKPENILLASKEIENLELKITDFGFAKCYDPQEGGLTETLGSPLYMAPEIIKKLPYDCTVDIWALGVLTYIMLSGKPPFKGRSKDEVFIEITTKNITYSGETWKNISKEAKNFVRKMLVRDPKQRSTAEDLIKDEFLVNNVEQGDIKESVLLDITNNLR